MAGECSRHLTTISKHLLRAHFLLHAISSLHVDFTHDLVVEEHFVQMFVFSYNRIFLFVYGSVTTIGLLQDRLELSLARHAEVLLTRVPKHPTAVRLVHVVALLLRRSRKFSRVQPLYSLVVVVAPVHL